MRRTVLLVSAWLLVGAVAVAAATLAVSRVGREVTGSRPGPLSATEVREELAAEVTTTTAGAARPSSTAAGTPPPTDATATSAPPSTAAAAPPATTAAPAAAEVRTYALVGGTATLRFSPGGVTVLAASPNAGFDVDVEPEHGNGVKVEFESATHKSRVDGWWDGGPRDDTREDAD